MIFALAGNQNCGKTTLFNQLTGSNQHVGNFPGVTVDQTIGILRSNKNCSVVDLPGIYSIRPYTNEEIVTRDFILNGKPDGIINIVDATNIERNLYLTLQLISLKIPIILALNMMDEVRNNGGTVNIEKMSADLGIPVIPISASKNEGIEDLINSIINVSKNKIIPKVYDFCEYGPVHRCIHAVTHLIEDHADRIGISARFCATKVIEGDEDFVKKLDLDQNEREMIEHTIVEMETESGLDRNAAVAKMRYDFIDKVCANSVIKSKESKEHKRSIKIDSVLTNKYLAIPLFIIIMALIFVITFNWVGGYLGDLIEKGINYLGIKVDALFTSYGMNKAVISLVTDGVFTGLGSIISFIPNIVILFMFLSILEDSGYMARVAFVMDKPLRKIGLSGRSFVPMLIGFGCSVPAVMSTRTLSSDRDRKMTIMLIPFISCSAKIFIYAKFAEYVFHCNVALLMFIMYIAGILIGILNAFIMKKTIFKGKPVPFVMELPNYRLPSVKSVLLLMWEKAKDFLQKAFTVIFIATVIIWFFNNFDSRLNFIGDRENATSLLVLIGNFIKPVFKPIGLDDPRLIASLIAGFTAKEAVITTLGNLTTAFSSMAIAISFLTFTLLYTPCVAAVAVIKKEMNSKLQTFEIVLAQCGIAYIFSLIVFNIVKLII